MHYREPFLGKYSIMISHVVLVTSTIHSLFLSTSLPGCSSNNTLVLYLLMDILYWSSFEVTDSFVLVRWGKYVYLFMYIRVSVD